MIYQDALKDKAVQYQRVARVLNQMKGCLASGYPFIFGFSVYESFESQQVAEIGHVFMPQTGEKMVVGHAVMACGYNDIAQCFYVQNSYGSSWGAKGFFTIPYTYLLNKGLASDFWTIRMIG
jgi:C1A family cysteine protease